MGKYVSKCDNAKVVKYRQQHECEDMQAIADNFGITRERVRQILKNAGVRTTASSYGRNKICPYCGKAKTYAAKKCYKCATSYLYSGVACETCGKIIFMYTSLLIRRINKNGQQHFFCNHKCHGSYLGKKYGFQKGYSGMPGPRPKSRKWDWDKVLEMYKVMSGTEVAKELGMSKGAVYQIAKWSNFRKRI